MFSVIAGSRFSWWSIPLCRMATRLASELIRAGYPAKDVVIASNPEAFGNMSLGSSDASEKDRRVTIIPR